MKSCFPSAHTPHFQRELEGWTLSVAEAKERALELTAARDLRVRKIAEDDVARERAANHLQRVELFQRRRLDMLAKCEVDSSSGVVFCGKHANVELARTTCEKLMEQLRSIMLGIVDTFEMEQLRREQLTTFETQYRKLELALGKAERLRRTYAQGGTAADVLGEMNVQESREIEVTVARQQVQLSSYQSVLKERREVWRMVVSHLQNLKIALRNKQEEVRTTIDEIRKAAASLKKKAGRLKARNQNLVVLRASVDSKVARAGIRRQRLEHEQSRVQANPGSLFDTDIWQEGVMQRMVAGTLAEYLQVRRDICILQ